MFDSWRSRTSITHRVAVLSDRVASCGLHVRSGYGWSDYGWVLPHGGGSQGCGRREEGGGRGRKEEERREEKKGVIEEVKGRKDGWTEER